MRLPILIALASMIAGSALADPTVSDDSATTEAETAVTLTPLVNDCGGGDLDIVGVGAPTNGTASLDTASDEVTYTPDSGFTGTDSFTATIEDKCGTQAQSTVNVTVEPPAIVLAKPQDGATFTTDERVEWSVTVNTTEPTSSATYYLDGASVGTDWTEPYNWHVAPGSVAPGTHMASATVLLDNGNELATDVATIEVVDTSNTAPSASDDSATTTEDVAIDIDVLANDSDPDAFLVSELPTPAFVQVGGDDVGAQTQSDITLPAYWPQTCDDMKALYTGWWDEPGDHDGFPACP